MFYQIFQRRIDHVGIGLSLMCAVHCALLPLLITSLPLWGLGFLANEYWEIAIIGSSFLIGCYSLLNGYKLTKSIIPLLLLASGFVFILCGQLLVSEKYEWIPMVIGGLLVATSHLKNWKAVHKVGTRAACCTDNECVGE